MKSKDAIHFQVPKLRARLLEKIVRYAPGVSALVRKQLRTRHVEDLPAVVPRCCVFFAVRLDEVRPDFFLAGRHLGQPVLVTKESAGFKTKGERGRAHLAGLGIVLAIDPPLVLNLEIPLEIQQKIGRGHGPAREEVSRHPALLVVVRICLVCKDVHKELAPGLEGA